MKLFLFIIVVFVLQRGYAQEAPLFEVPPPRTGVIVNPKLAADVGGEQVKIENVTAQIKFIKPYTTKDWKIEFEVIATGDEKVWQFESSSWPCDLKVALLDADGKRCPLTNKGNELNAFIYYDTAFTYLESDKPRKWVLKMNELFVLKPGVWTLDVRYEIGKGKMGTASSRRLEFPFTLHVFNLTE